MHDYRLMAVAAPHWIARATTDKKSLNSRTPFSLQNALRLAASNALQGQGALSQSNWATRSELSSSVFMMEHWDDERTMLQEKLQQLRPNVLFIGSMTLAFPGAIEVAKLAKQILGDSVFIVLGGKHANETIIRDRKTGTVRHTDASPVRLMATAHIPSVFDLVCAGPAEELVAVLAEQIGQLIETGQDARTIYSDMATIAQSAAGDWRVSWIDEEGQHDVQSVGRSIDYSAMPVPAEVFGISGAFNVFGTELTAHAFSDTSPGCVFDCFFCSERASINGKMIDRNHAADRLVRQMTAAYRTAVQENGTSSLSVFVEDSTLLNSGKDPKSLHLLVELIRAAELPIRFGGQFTVDQLIDPDMQQAVRDLHAVGLDYVFIGMETADNDVAQQMSKNTAKKTSWLDRTEVVVRFLAETGIKLGVAVMFGLGESQQMRRFQLDTLRSWQLRYGQPVVVSLNLATEHPLQRPHVRSDYSQWETTDVVYLHMFQKLFGEAAVEHAYMPAQLPSIVELQEIDGLYQRLVLQQ